MMLALTHLPPELISHVLSFVEPEDLAQVNLTCTYLYHTVKDNSALFRAIYLRHLDEPGLADLDWAREIRDLVRLRRICSADTPDKQKHLRFVYETTIRLLSRSSSSGGRTRLSTSYRAGRNARILQECFVSPAVIYHFLCRSFLFQRAKAPPARQFPFPKQLPSEERQMSAKLHCLYGQMVLNWSRTRTSRTYPFAASKVYDIRECTPRTRWGPFMDEGPGPRGTVGNEEGQAGLPMDRVDWEKVEAIMIVIWYNMKSKDLDRLPIFEQFWGVPFAGCWPNSYIPHPVPRGMTDLDSEDPYDVTGTWLRIVCFLDYNDFFTYNFPLHDDLPAHLPRPIIDEIEATRLIIMKIHVTKIEPPGPEDGQALPVVHFEGLSRSLDSTWDENANSDLEGSVRLTREGEVRWTSQSIFQGQARWRSECVQVGGLRASKVVGSWFDKDYDPSGPCGPTAYWKIGDRHPNVDDNQISEQDYLPIKDGYEDEARLRNRQRVDPHGLHFQIDSDDDDEEYEEEEYEDEGSQASTPEVEIEAGEAAEGRGDGDAEGSSPSTSKLLAAELEDDDNDDDLPYASSPCS